MLVRLALTASLSLMAPTMNEPQPDTVRVVYVTAPAPVLYDVAPLPPPPAFMSAWGGATPATLPQLAAELSQTNPEAYEQWLLSTLPEGSTVKRLRATVTAYCPCAICCDERTETTSTGLDTNEHPYGIAADPLALRYGTMVHVPGYLTESAPGGTYAIDDTGGALRRSRSHGILHLDVRFRSHEWARHWGTRRMWIYTVSTP